MINLKLPFDKIFDISTSEISAPLKDTIFEESFYCEETELNGIPAFIYRKTHFFASNTTGEFTSMDKYFHLTWCNILQNKYDNKKYELLNFFTITTDSNGYFSINYSDKSNVKEKLRLCKKCYEQLDLHKKGYGNYYKIYEKFPFNRYIKDILSKKLELSENFQKYDEEKFINDTYSANWQNIRNYHLIKANFNCEECGLNYKVNNINEYKETIKNQSLQPLEVHHKNRNKRDNSSSNLQVLCVKCHDKKHPNRKYIIND